MTISKLFETVYNKGGKPIFLLGATFIFRPVVFDLSNQNPISNPRKVNNPLW